MLKKFVKTTAIIGAVMTTLGVTTPVSAASCGTVTANSLYVRSGASTSHNILGTVSKGNTVEIKDTQNGWHKISYNGNDGWLVENTSHLLQLGHQLQQELRKQLKQEQ